MLRLLIGLFLLPAAGALSWSALRCLAGVAVGSQAGAPFGVGLALAFAGWVAGRALVADPVGPLGWGARMARWGYVLGHELTHALAAWSFGGSVYAIKVGEKGGHVDLSGSNAVVALAPYCVPFYAFLVAIGWRVLLWARPGAGGEALFLFLMGIALGAHFLFTWTALTETRQPDLDAAGGVVFSLAWILVVNALVLMLILKGLFPGAVPLAARLGESAELTRRFWSLAWLWGRPAAEGAWRAVAP
jgi:hypothetical protein